MTEDDDIKRGLADSHANRVTDNKDLRAHYGLLPITSEPGLYQFILESNRIEGMHEVTDHDVTAHERLLSCEQITIPDLETFVATITGIVSPLRLRESMNVQVGTHRPMRGGPEVGLNLSAILAGMLVHDPYATHCLFETLHPFMDGNGRSGRALWAWHMRSIGRDPFALPFLHRWYYQSLNNFRG